MQINNNTQVEFLVGNYALKPSCSLSVHESFIDIEALEKEFSVEVFGGVITVTDAESGSSDGTEIAAVSTDSEAVYVYPDRVLNSDGSLSKRKAHVKEAKRLDSLATHVTPQEFKELFGDDATQELFKEG